MYTGDQISSHYVYAQMYTYIFCVLMYSAGIPLLYPITAIFFALFYCVYKFLFLKYYQVTTRFDENLPLLSTEMLKFAIFIHIIVAAFQLSNEELIPPTALKTEFLSTVLPEAVHKRLFDQWHVMLYVTFWLIFLLLWIFKNIVIKIISAIWHKCPCYKAQEEDFDAEELSSFSYSRDIYKELYITPLKNLYLKT